MRRHKFKAGDLVFWHEVGWGVLGNDRHSEYPLFLEDCYTFTYYGKDYIDDAYRGLLTWQEAVKLGIKVPKKFHHLCKTKHKAWVTSTKNPSSKGADKWK